MNLLDSNDRPGEYPPSWYAASATTKLDLTPLDKDIRVDVCIVGAGYSGLSAGLHLAQAGKNVCIIDAHRVGWGASGRNGGQLGSGQRLEQSELEHLLGKKTAHSLWQLAQDSKTLVKSLIDIHNMDCKPKPGIIHANHRARFNSDSKKEVRLLNEEYGYDAMRFIDKEECREMIGSEAYYGGVLDTNAAHLHPLNYALGLGKAAIDAGASIYERTRALSIETGSKVKIQTERGVVTADHLIFACNGYLGDLDQTVARRVMPINNFIVATQPLSQQLAKSLIRDDVAVADSRFVVNYFRLSEDNRLLFGGGETYGYRFPDDICKFVSKPMLNIFPQLADTALEYGWGGTLAITRSRLPHFARPSTNINSISGYSGHGLGMATLAGRLVADSIVGNGKNFELFQAINCNSFPGGPALRSPLLILAMLYHSLLDKV
ncbi:MAG: FAD-binding oxidoreductase [Rhizobiaceae bacterium]|nr:FAD-binding oxidoreductase [Rhizobiaceae bacterium]